MSRIERMDRFTRLAALGIAAIGSLSCSKTHGSTDETSAVVNGAIDASLTTMTRTASLEHIDAGRDRGGADGADAHADASVAQAETADSDAALPPCAPPLLVLHDGGLEKVTLDPGVEGDVTAAKITTGDIDSDRRITEILRAPIRDGMDLLRTELKEGAKIASIHGRCVATLIRPELASVRCDLDTYSGGPYPNTGAQGASVRVCGSKVRPIALDDFCGPRCVEAASAAVSERLRRRVGASVQADLKSAVEEGEPLLQQFAIGPRGLTVSLTWLLPHVYGDARVVDLPGSAIAGALDGKDDALIRLLRAAWTKR